MIEYSDSERLCFDEYYDFLTRCDLGSQYHRKDFEIRVRKLLANVDITIAARNEGKLVGICLGLTDFAYFLFVTDLGVDREFMDQGVGRELLRRLHDKAGGVEDISMVTISHVDAIGFYAACGAKNSDALVARFCNDTNMMDI